MRDASYMLNLHRYEKTKIPLVFLLDKDKMARQVGNSTFNNVSVQSKENHATLPVSIAWGGSCHAS